MVYPTHYLLQWGGTFTTDPAEIWSNGIRLMHDPNIDGSALMDFETDEGMQAACTEYATKVIAHVQNVASRYSGNTKLRYVKFNKIGPDGRQVNQTKTFRSDMAAAGVSPTSGAVHAITHSTCVTFLTEASRGRASKGRLFVPHSSMVIATGSGRYAPGDCQATADAWGTFLTSLSDAPGLDVPNSLIPVVVSNLEPSPGLSRPITRAQVGNFPDYMGSRRNRTTEVRVQSALVTN
jgi:hypothetical protein